MRSHARSPGGSWPGEYRLTRPGFALATALLATILVAALLAALFFAVNEETRTGSAIARGDEALAAAESAIEAGLDQLRMRPLDYSPVGAMESLSMDGEALPAAVHITRLDSGLFWLVAVVGDEDNAGAITRRIGVLASALRDSSDSITIVRVAERGWSQLF